VDARSPLKAARRFAGALLASALPASALPASALPASALLGGPVLLGVLLAGCPGEEALSDPGSFLLRRLNRKEYDNTVRDLLGTELRPARDFPADDHGYGFDTIAAALTVSPLHVEMWERAARALVAEAMAVPPAWPLDQRAEAEDPAQTTTSGGADQGAGFWNMYVAGSFTATLTAPADGVYMVGARAFSHEAGSEPARMTVAVDGELLGTFDVAADASSAQVYQAEVALESGHHEVVVAFINDFWEPATGADRNLLVDWLRLYGPTDREAPPSPMRERLLICSPETSPQRDCAADVLRAFAVRAFRRPVDESEVVGLLRLYDEARELQAGWEEALSEALVGVLLSPHFLFRVELDEDPASATPHRLSPYELATRLSYFLWSSMPDAALFAAADAGELETREQVEAQVQRMLDDERAQGLVDDFFGQWLYVRAVDDAAPDGATFPFFDDAMRTSMKQQMSLFFASMVEDDRPIGDLLLAEDGFLDARLRKHYGLPIDGETSGFSHVDLTGTGRGSLLSMGGMLVATSYPLRTSPTRRGKWVLGQLLCSDPPPPPAGVEGLPESGEAAAGTLRERLARHRTDPVCASCHERMDEAGFALEHYDPTGRYRDEEGGFPVDATGTFPDGTSFEGAAELSAVVAADPSFPRCAVQKAWTYAMSRGPSGPDWRGIDAALTEWEARGQTMRELFVAIATSDAFRSRRGGE
jgi:hypothetical protein